MYLYLVQHGEARKEEEDPSRGLTKKGMDDVWKIADFARKRGVRIFRIVHSGKMRAMQTAEMMADFLSPEQDVVEAAGLGPMDDPEKWAGLLDGMNEDVMLVGHLPFMARLAGLLLCGDKEKMFIDFTMGGIVCLKRHATGRWALAWLVGPDMVR